MRDDVLAIIARVSGKAPAALAPGSDLAVDLGIDSPTALELLMALEDAFGIEISDDEAARLETVGDVVDLVVGRASA